MKSLLVIGMLLGVFALAYPHLIASHNMQLFSDSAQLGLLGMGLLALGIARKQHNKDHS